MTKKYLKRNITRRKKNNKKTRKMNRRNSTKKIKYGGDEALVELYKQKTLFRRRFKDLIIQIANKNNSRNKIKDGINLLIQFFNNNRNMINTLIPVSSSGKYIDKETGNEPIVDFVSPVIYILDTLSYSNLITDKDIIRILNAYFLNGGNMNNMSSRFKLTPFKNELNKKRINNIRLLLDKSNSFHIIEDGLDEQTKEQLVELIPNEQKIDSEKAMPEETSIIQEKEEPIIQEEHKFPKLQLPYSLPTNNDVGYDRTLVPEFWKPIFQGDQLLKIREIFMRIYESDRYTSDVQKQIKICNLLETIIPGYWTKYTLDFRETAKTLVNVNILNCFITLFYGIILQRLYETKQEYLFIFKGGRALQLSLNGIPDIGKYFSEDTDILIIPNKYQGVAGVYDLEKMENLSEHIAYLVKWIFPPEINVFISLPSNPKNTNKEITKLLYNDNKLFKPLSDIGFGEINEDIRQFFDTLVFSPLFINQFETIGLFITPTLDDMLAEKLFYYSKYLKMKGMIERKEPIMDQNYVNLTDEECERMLLKFKRAILKLVEAILKRDYVDVTDLNEKDSSRIILRSILKKYEDYSNQEKEEIVISIFP
jgi:hypothetical protein